jgi:hypothetical protein
MRDDLLEEFWWESLPEFDDCSEVILSVAGLFTESVKSGDVGVNVSSDHLQFLEFL